MPPAATVSLIFCAELLAREHVALVVPDRAVERAEAARGRAHVRVVDVAVDDVRDDAVADAAPCGGASAARPSSCNRRLGTEPHRVLEAEPAAVRGYVEQRVDRGAVRRRRSALAPRR